MSAKQFFKNISPQVFTMALLTALFAAFLGGQCLASESPGRAPGLATRRSATLLPKDPREYCKSPTCLKSLGPHEKMLQQKFSLIFEQSPVCAKIAEEINDSPIKKLETTKEDSTFPKTEFKQVDLERIYGSTIFLRWNPVHSWYNNPDLFKHEKDTIPVFRPDVWLITPYLNDHVPRLVASGGWGTGLKDQSFEVNPLSYDALHWSDADNYNSLPQLTRPPMGPCNSPGDPLDQIFAWDAKSRAGVARLCQNPSMEVVHAPSDKKTLYRVISDFTYIPGALAKNKIDPLKWPIFLGNEPIQFAALENKIYVLYTFSDFETAPFDFSSPVKHLTTGIIIRVVLFSGDTYSDLCLLAVGTGITAIYERSDIEER